MKCPLDRKKIPPQAEHLDAGEQRQPVEGDGTNAFVPYTTGAFTQTIAWQLPNRLCFRETGCTEVHLRAVDREPNSITTILET